MTVIGIDFDNTIVCHDPVLHQTAVEWGLIPAGIRCSKTALRDDLRRRGLEEEWIRLQGYAYGPGMRNALPFDGVLPFLRISREEGIEVRIISHRTVAPFRGPRYDLHQAAYAWLKDHGFHDPLLIGLCPSRVHFEPTKQEKLDRIQQSGCTHFIDDLPEFLLESGFPAGVERLLFDPEARAEKNAGYRRIGSWRDALDVVFAGRRT